jgi:hypothetical protein
MDAAPLAAYFATLSNQERALYQRLHMQLKLGQLICVNKRVVPDRLKHPEECIVVVVRKMETRCPRVVQNNLFVNHHRNGKQKTQRNLAYIQTRSGRPHYRVCIDESHDCHGLRVGCVQPKCKCPRTEKICTLAGLFVHALPSGVICHRDRPRLKETIAHTRYTLALSRGGGVHVGVINTQ